MISDGDLYKLAVFLGSCAMLLIVLYHFLEVNAQDNNKVNESVTAPNSTSAKNTVKAPGLVGPTVVLTEPSSTTARTEIR